MKYLITGGTGTFGRAVLERLLISDRVSEIRIFSRDESKQDDMKLEYKDDRIKYYIGDVRDKHSVDAAMQGVHYVFHAAAMKQIGSCEQFPIEAIRTNVYGTANVMDEAIRHKVACCVLLSSDKAVNPVGAMGFTKALAEKVMITKSHTAGDTVLCATRFGNLINSRNSVIPLWRKQMKAGDPVTVTDWNMTRFVMTIAEAVDLVLFAFHKGRNGEVITPVSKACTVRNLFEAVCGCYKPVKLMGAREGERMHEYLTEDYCSDRAERLTVKQLIELI